ncbi:MAG: exodeoxyribonuclease VII large subunit, partial [Bacteriovoracia bacterium]
MIGLLTSPASVSQTVNAIKSCIEGGLDYFWIEGEVSNLSNSAAGHYYFTLSDSNASLAVALFRSDAFRNPAIKKVKDGDKIICYGKITFYDKRGTVQLLAQRIVNSG